MEPLLVVTASVVLALALGRAIHSRLGFVTEVESVSMAPALAAGRRLLTRRQSAARPLRRGDMVVVHSAELHPPIVKRVVGLPGERLDVRADGRVRVAGHDLVEPYVVRGGGRPATFQVPVGHLLLLGDYRARSSDARVWREPYVPVSAVLGRVLWCGRNGPPRSPRSR
ncbi:MAG: lepB [Frankiales bacterium]|nr:lepB [Frankiales bacterium]